MSIFNLFQKAPQQQQQPQQPQNNAGGGEHIQNNPTVPNATNSPQQLPSGDNPNPESPVAKFNDLWKMEPTQQNQAPNFRIDPAQLQQVTSGMDFTKSIDRNEMAKIAAGGPEAVEAMMNMLNTVGRNVFSNAAQFTSHMTESGYSTAQQAIDRGLPNLVKKQHMQNDLFQANPKLRDPQLQPVVMAIQSQVAQKYPNATPEEVNNMVSEYFTKVIGGAFAAPEQQGQQSPQNANFDFASFLS